MRIAEILTIAGDALGDDLDREAVRFVAMGDINVRYRFIRNPGEGSPLALQTMRYYPDSHTWTRYHGHRFDAEAMTADDFELNEPEL